MPPPPLRGALIGAGSIAPFHLRAWRAVPGVEIVAVADLARDRAEALAGEFDIPGVYADGDDLLAREGIDFVDIATAPHQHRGPVLAAAARGVHVFCQKPFAGSVAEAREMIAACEAAGVRCVVNENWRWRAWYREVRRLLAAGEIGTPTYARFCRHGDDVLPNPDGSPPPLLARQPYTAAMPRLILYEWGVHLIDVMRFLFGDVRAVFARTGRRSSLVAGEDWAVVLLGFGGPVTGVVDLSWSTPLPEERRLPRGSTDPFVVVGDAGAIELDPYRDDALVLTGRDGRQEVRPARGGRTRAEAYQDCYAAAHRHFARCLLTGEPAETEARDNWNTSAAVFGAYESTRTRSVVAVES